MYWFINKKTNTPGVGTSLKAVAKALAVKYDTLTYQFTRQGKKDYETEEIRISRVKAVSCKRK